MCASMAPRRLCLLVGISSCCSLSGVASVSGMRALHGTGGNVVVTAPSAGLELVVAGIGSYQLNICVVIGGVAVVWQRLWLPC
jgi:hypothetical protein